ncbi:MAG TPA: class I SAM-dependent methyltransferase [Desulfuromonadaceae bacterium]
MTEPFSFDEKYFATYYGNYSAQNPPGKLAWYLSLLLKQVTGGNLLDIGCSYGRFISAAASSFTCFGMDVDLDVVRKASSFGDGKGFVNGRLPHIPFARLDVITMLDVLEHLSDPEAALESACGALRPGGILLIVVPVYDGPLGPLVTLFDRDPSHVLKESRQYWLSCLGRHFEIIEWQGAFRKLLWGTRYMHLPTTSFRQIAPAIAIVARKAC